MSWICLVAPTAAAIIVITPAAAAKAVAAPAEEQDDEDDDPDTVVAGIAEHVDFLSPHSIIHADAELRKERRFSVPV